MAEMIKKPKVMEAAQSEFRRVYGNKGYVDESELHQLIYLKFIIKETLRLHPSLPLLVPRSNREACQIMRYHIPANLRIVINAWAIERDPRYWVDAERFMPERFFDSSIDYKGINFELIPFGAGRRMCPGIAFATPKMELPLAKLLYHFDWKLPEGINNEELDMTELFGTTEAIAEIESRDESTKNLSQNDSLAQVLAKEHPGRVRGVGPGLCPTNPSYGGQTEKYQRQIEQLQAEAAEKTKKIQIMENIVRFLVRWQGDDLPPEIASEMDALGGGVAVPQTRPSSDDPDLLSPP
ncbi:hypothetical protein PIB30_037819 [Stylosanthes scabra]|uniref:Uncharacterized protein n=1 Tax=Stylosanthes scabra TaxID=79078 RepID=A0ABU6REE4_9FABA|nr:hypothetical protein [Stylosanthes scabra]